MQIREATQTWFNSARRVSLVALACGFACVATAQQPRGAPYSGTAEDFMQISQLFSRYNYAIDNGDGVAWAELFTERGVFQDPSNCAIGREQLISVVGRKPALGKDQLEHHVHSLGPITYLDHDHATAHSTVMVVAETGFGKKPGGILITGTYDDELVRVGDAWLFSYRLVHRPSDKPAIACPRPKATSRLR